MYMHFLKTQLPFWYQNMRHPGMTNEDEYKGTRPFMDWLKSDIVAQPLAYGVVGLSAEDEILIDEISHDVACVKKAGLCGCAAYGIRCGEKCACSTGSCTNVIEKIDWSY
jgi:hypothetical protein